MLNNSKQYVNYHQLARFNYQKNKTTNTSLPIWLIKDKPVWPVNNFANNVNRRMANLAVSLKYGVNPLIMITNMYTKKPSDYN